MQLRDRIDHTSTLLSGAILGATAMYIFDSQQGNRRRALARDKMIRAVHLLGRFARRQAKDTANRALGHLAEIRSSVRDHSAGVDDETLVSRVRAQLGHVVAHPGSLEVTARDGHVIISGPVLRRDIERMCDRLNKTRGVRDFDLQVEAHDSPQGVPGLQGRSRGERGDERTA